MTRAGQRLEKPIAVERLQQVVECMDVERLERVLVEGRDEHEERQRFAAEGRDDVEPAGARHLDVEEDEIGLRAADRVDRVEAVLALGDHLESLLPVKEHPQPLAGERLVVRDDDARGGSIGRHATRAASSSPEDADW